MKKSLIFGLVFLAIPMVAFAGFFDSSEVKKIKISKFTDYPSATIGDAFDACFSNSDWEYIETKKGQKIVVFTGVIKPGTREDAVQDLYLELTYDPRGFGLALMNGLKQNLGQKRFDEIVRSNRSEKEKFLQIIREGTPGYWTAGKPVKAFFVFTGSDSFELQDFEGPGFEELTVDAFLDVVYHY